MYAICKDCGSVEAEITHNGICYCGLYFCCCWSHDCSTDELFKTDLEAYEYLKENNMGSLDQELADEKYKNSKHNDFIDRIPITPKVDVKIVYLDNYCGGEDNEKMKYAKKGDSGFDLRAASNEDDLGYMIAPKSVIIIPTGIKVAVPEGFELQVRTRSGSPIKKGFVVANSPGTVDAGYRGTVGVIAHNISDEMIYIDCGERIAQGVVCPVYQANFIEVDELDETERGDNGFNSTGVK